MSDQWIRKVNLTVFQGEKGLDLSDFHFRFNIEAADVESPNSAVIRIYNLAKDTVSKIKGEFSEVALNAGYENGNYGLIFKGTIKQFRIGREDNISSYLDILAADSDILYDFGMVSKTLIRGSTPLDQMNVITEAMGGKPSDLDTTMLLVDKQHIPNLRGSVLFGMARARMRDLATTLDASWSLQNGKIVISDKSGYSPDDIVEINAITGLIGIPEQTDSGIFIRCLLNSRLRIGGTVKINNSDVNQLIIRDPNAAPVPFNQFAGIQPIAPLSPDGTYRVFTLDHEGDTRGNEWYTKIIGLAVDTSAPKDKAVSKN